MKRLSSFALAALASMLFVSCVATRAGVAERDFAVFLTRMDDAQLQLQNGNAGPYKELWSHADDVTLIGGFGGNVEKGWPAVSERLDWAATQFTHGQNAVERLQLLTSGRLAYIVQREQIRFIVPGETAESERRYRVTMVCRREDTEWRIIHRHADAQVARQPAKE